MAEFAVSGRMKVKTLKNTFKEYFGVSLRVYKGNRFADDEDTLASVRKDSALKTKDDMKVSGNMLIGTFEKKFNETFGIRVQVADKDNEKLLDDSITLSKAGKQK
jgi:hypothetical protein